MQLKLVFYDVAFEIANHISIPSAYLTNYKYFCQKNKEKFEPAIFHL